MTNVVVVGCQWGDEGKGKLVDYLSGRADVIVRFQGGNNAGHTIVIDEKVFKLSLLPSGIIREGKLSVIGNGVVLDPWALRTEIDSLSKLGINVTRSNLIVAENVPLILSFHKTLDLLREKKAGSKKIGTTGRGIGPAYEDKVGRRAIRLSDLDSPRYLRSRLERCLEHHNILRNGYGEPMIEVEDIEKELGDISLFIKQFSAPVWQVLDKKNREDKNILFEGAQGSFLDVDFGTYPFVTSSNTIAGAASLGAGFSARKIDFVLGVVKAYTTRVGEGPFPTELKHDQIGLHLETVGHEKGTVTGRNRRCGWFDAALVKQSCIVNGVEGIAITKLDVLDGLKELKICTGYEMNGKLHPYLPSSIHSSEVVKPIYEKIDGWTEPTKGINSLKELPRKALAYLRRIEELVGCPISFVSTSPEREDLIDLNDPFKRSEK
tara:strand:- start:44 stop:1348 length:1305 start_codon:yes stop_codon:yes gene_type:complete